MYNLPKIYSKGWYCVSNEAIEKIKAAEQSAADMIADAKKTAADIRMKADADAENAKVKAKSAAALLAKKSAEKASEQSENIINEGVDAARADAKRTVATAEANLDEASENIIRGIFAKWQ